MMMRHLKQTPAKNEDGLVALLVVGIMIILLTLITVAFTKLMGRESRQALDRVLSTQAYYAAQSGINDAKDYINTHPEALLNGNTCDTLTQKGYPPYLGPASDTASDVNKVTCVVADTAPEQLYYQIPAGRSKIFEMSSATNFGKVLFSWDNSAVAGGAFAPGNYQTAPTTAFTKNLPWNTPSTKAPVLEVTFYSIPDGGGDLPSLLSRGRTIYLYPSLGATPSGASTYATSTDPDGGIIYKSCQANIDLHLVFAGATSMYHCNTVVTPTASKHIFVKVSSFYGTASLAVRAVDTTGSGNAVAIENAQAILDATGKGGSDVLKRLQTIIDYRPSNLEPGDTIETINGLCKRLEYNLTTGQPQVDSSVSDVVTLPDADTNKACHAPDAGL